uniref:5-formyltetrahydrofolate cyclo-ligase n=1 Tax=Bursaphelenchus xylophilus TaxID=6326 RepID=A0A1I7S7Z4_BURXY
MTLKAAKKLLRKEMATKLAQISEDEIDRQSKAVFDKVRSAEWFVQSQRISIYVNTAGEIKTDEIIKLALLENKEVFIPWFQKGNPKMFMVQINSVKEFDDLKPTLWDIRQFESIDGRTTYDNTGPLNLILAPGVAFTRSGDRLGHGMGFYDKFFREHNLNFPNATAPYRVALALNEQILEEVPVEDTDVKINLVLTADD